MDAVKFIKESKRLCKAQESCEKYAVKIGGCCLTNIFTEFYSAEKTVAIVEQWSKYHPVKTRQSEFLKMFPNAKVDYGGILDINPCRLESSVRKSMECNIKNCRKCRREYWLADVTDND